MKNVCKQEEMVIKKKGHLLLGILGIFLIIISLSNVNAFDWDTGLEGYISFDETGATSTAADNSSYSNDLVGINIGTGDWVTGKVNNGVDLDGSTEYLNWSSIMTELDDDNVGALSIWVNPDTVDADFVFSPWRNNTMRGGLKLESSLIKAGLTVVVYNQTTYTIGASAWTHIAWVKNTTHYLLYVNGSLANSTADEDWFDDMGGLIETWIGRKKSDGSQYFQGVMDELGMWNRTLTANEINQLWNSGEGLTYNQQPQRVTLNSPANETKFYETDVLTQAFNVTVISGDNENITNVSLYTNISGSWELNDTIDLSALDLTQNTQIFNMTLLESSLLWGIETCDTSDGCSVSANRTLIFSTVNFGICNASITDDFLNITFKDEATLLFMNGTIQSSTWEYYLGDGTSTKTFTFSTSSNYSNYTFCASVDKTFYVSPNVNYLLSGYPNRIYQPGTLTLTSSLINKTLYLLSSSDGIYTTFIVVTQANTPISGVDMLIRRTISGTNITISQGQTDAAGSFTAWLNPNYNHYIIASKTGLGITTQVIKPTQTTYTLILASGVSNYTFVNDYAGLKWFVFPSAGTLKQGVSTNFGFNISAENDNLVKCKIELLNKDKSIILASDETITGNASLCSVLTAYTPVSTNATIKGRLLVDLGSGYKVLEDDAYWRYIPYNTTNATLTDWFNGLKSFDLTYFNNDEQHREYTQILLFFLLITIIGAVMNYAGWDIQTNGGMVYLMGILIIAASITGFLNLSYISPFSWMDKYFIAIVYSMFMIGFTTRNLT